ncbi:MAG: MFS transporter [Burkholderiaceae bacterium]
MRINLQTVADDARYGKLQILVLVICSVLMTIDGYDLTVIGVALPSVIAEMKMDPSVAGLLVSAALVGMMFGAIIFGTISDRIGRVKTMAVCVAIFSLFTAATGLCREPISFAAMRFLSGVGLGGIVPLLTAVVSEFSPKASRARTITFMFAGYSLGGMMAAILGKQFLESFGWQIVFFAAGAPIVLIPIILAWMPESMAILQKRGDQQRLRELCRRIDPSVRVSDSDQMFVPIAKAGSKVPIARLFSEGRGLTTVLIWISFFCGLFMLYALNSWLTKLMAMAGYSVGSALTFLLLLNCGAMVGCFTGGWLSDKFGMKRVLSMQIVIGSIATILMAQKMPTELLMVVIFIIGFMCSGGQGVMYAYAGQFYPNEIRATGVGVASGMGRFGGIFAPILIGLLISLKLPFEQNFYVIAGFGLAQAIAAMLFNDRVADFNAVRRDDTVGSPESVGAAAKTAV